MRIIFVLDDQDLFRYLSFSLFYFILILIFITFWKIKKYLPSSKLLFYKFNHDQNLTKLIS